MGDAINNCDLGHEDTASRVNKDYDGQRKPYGSDSFDAEAREAFGHHLRLFMSLADGAAASPASSRPDKAMPDDVPAIARRLKRLGRDIASGMADQLELLVRFDDLEGWKVSGSRHCAAWVNSELGISLKLGWEYLRVGRKLRTLPVTRALFRAGSLTWSMVRQLSRVADEDNEALLCHAALDAPVSDVERLCNEYRWQLDGDEANLGEGENVRSLRQIEARSLTWSEASNGNTTIRLSLPLEVAQAFLNSIECSLEEVGDNNDSMQQRRADAAVLMAESSLQNAGKSAATADRYQVIVSVEEDTLSENTETKSTPEKRPVVRNGGAIATETARRIACDCSIFTVIHKHGEPVDIGRKSRLWPPAMARAIKNRDQHCQYPGCTQTRHLQIHHIVHWADGGSTCVDNGVSICVRHHSILHEGGYRIERISDLEGEVESQFMRQQSTGTFNQVEKKLRGSFSSFERVRQLSPTRFRFRVVNREGLDIRDISDIACDAVTTSKDESVATKKYAKESSAARMKSCSSKRADPMNMNSRCSDSTHIDSTFVGLWFGRARPDDESNFNPDNPDNPDSSDWWGVAECAGRYRVNKMCNA